MEPDCLDDGPQCKVENSTWKKSHYVPLTLNSIAGSQVRYGCVNRLSQYVWKIHKNGSIHQDSRAISGNFILLLLCYFQGDGSFMYIILKHQ